MLLDTAINFCVLVFLFDVSRGRDDKIPLVRLLELQTEHCNEALLCTVRILDKNYLNQEKACCHSCSCEVNCIEEGTCCPDYDFIDLIGKNISNNVAEFSNRLANVNLTSNKQQQLSCIDPTEPKFKSVSDRSKVTYKMVSSCPITWDGNLEISKKCEEPQDIGTFEFDLFIPVTSLKSGTTYRNKYCLLCNENLNGKTNVEYWTSTMYCRADSKSSLDHVAPYGFFTALQRFDYSYCHLVFSPNTDIRSDFELHRCDMVDIETCPEASDKYLNDVCKSFYLPVTWMNLHKVKPVRFRNIACFLCNMNVTFYPFCKIFTSNYFKQGMYGFTLNIQRDANNHVVNSEEHENDVLNFEVIEEESNECGTGFIRENSKIKEATCVRVFCPWNFYISEGECIPTFTRLDNIIFRATLAVRRAETFGKTMLDEIRANYMAEVAKIGANIFQQFTYGLWEVENDFDILAVSFSTNQGNYTYNAMLRQYALFLEMVCIQTIKAKSSAIKVSTFHTKYLTHSYTRIPYIDPKPKEIHRYEEPESSIMRFDIYMSHLCYRVARPKSETPRYKGNRHDYAAFQKYSYNMTLLCIDYVYKNLTDISSAFMFGGTCAQTTADFFKNKQNYKVRKNINSDNGSNGKQKNIKAMLLNIERDRLGTRNADDDTWSDLSKGLLFGGVVFVAVGVLVVIALLRKRKQQADVVEKEDAQDSQQE